MQMSRDGSCCFEERPPRFRLEQKNNLPVGAPSSNSGALLVSNDVRFENCLYGNGKGKAMSVDPIVISVIIGAIAGYLATTIVKGYGYGLLGNIAVGMIGAWLAVWASPSIGLSFGSGFVEQIVVATLGAIVLLLLIGLARRIA
jgi:uncharacterized membrane protein YeaQ/YmgE (transglycosylase-associated protein family)